MMTNKRKYVKPQLRSHGSIEDITGWGGKGHSEFFGGNEGASSNKVAFRKNGAGDLGT